MIALDTSVLARYILHDTPSEQRRAEQFISENDCSVNWTVLVELCWVLERSARLPRQQVSDALSAIARMANIAVPDPPKLDWVLQRHAAGADFADMVHLVSALGGATGFATFDRKFAQQAGQLSPLKVEILRA